MNLVTGPEPPGAGPAGVSRGLPRPATFCWPPTSSRLWVTRILPSQVDHPDHQPSAKLYHHHGHHGSFQNISARHRATWLLGSLPSLLGSLPSLSPALPWLSSRTPSSRLEVLRDTKEEIRPQTSKPLQGLGAGIPCQGSFP